MTTMKYAALSLKLLGCWIVGCFLLWITYGLNLELEQGTIAKIAAEHFVMKMSLIMSILVGASWWWCLAKNEKPRKRWTGALRAALSTAVSLALYTLIVLIRRNLWSASQGLSVYAQFLPLVGRVNAEFLSGFKWIIFLVEVIPLMSLASALIFQMGFGGWLRRKPPR
jgi:predicted neutral ceramidase superfamily lipid hydrolase